MQLEDDFAVKHAVLGAGNGGVEDFHALGEREEEAAFLFFDDLLDARIVDFRIGFGHFGANGVDELVEEGLAGAELVAVADGAAADAAQHIGAAFVARDDAVGDGERAGADVVSDHLEGRGFRIDGFAARLLKDALDAGEQVLEEVDVVVVVHALENGGNALKTHARVDGGLRKLVHDAALVAVELHENEVPDLDVAVAVFLGAPRRAALDLVAVVVEDFGAGTTRPRVAHHPEVVGHVAGALVVADADDALGGNADFLVPDVVGLVVLGIDRDPELFGGQHEVLRQELPGEVDGVMLEVVAEREVAEHLEERVVAGGVADVVKVVVLAAGADALLGRRGAGVRALVEAEEHVLELVHAGVREEKRRVMGGDDRARGDDRVALAFVEVQKGAANVCDFHKWVFGTPCQAACAWSGPFHLL